MAKKTKKENIRIEVYPKIYLRSLSTEKQEILDANHIVNQIKRHVDDVDDVNVVWDESVICEHCEWEWEVNENPNDPDYGLGEPMCCVKAQKEYLEEENAAV